MSEAGCSRPTLQSGALCCLVLRGPFVPASAPGRKPGLYIGINVNAEWVDGPPSDEDGEGETKGGDDEDGGDDELEIPPVRLYIGGGAAP